MISYFVDFEIRSYYNQNDDYVFIFIATIIDNLSDFQYTPAFQTVLLNMSVCTADCNIQMEGF